MSKTSENPYKWKVPDGMIALGGTFRVYPRDDQLQPIFQALGNARYVYNHMKAMCDIRYTNNSDLKFPTKKALDAVLTQFKKEHPFLGLSDSTSLQAETDHYRQGMMDFITRKTPDQGKPHFKGKNYFKQSITMKNNHIKTLPTIRFTDNTHIRLPIIGVLKTNNTAYLQNITILRATLIWRQDLDYFYISVNGYKPRPRKRRTTGKIVGVDLGLSNEWLVTSDGKRWSVPDTKSADVKERYWQSIKDRRLNDVKEIVDEYNKLYGDYATNKYSHTSWQRARKTKSKNSIKKHNIRLDQVRKAVKYLIDHYDVIVIEDLKVKNLLKNHHLAKSIQNASWYLFRKVLEYECDWYGKTLITVSPRYTSRICSSCHKRNPAFTGIKTNKWLAVREWTCPFCNCYHDRDVNAAINIMYRGLKKLRHEEITVD